MRPDVALAFDRMARGRARRRRRAARSRQRVPHRRRAGAAVRRATPTRSGSRRRASRCTASAPSSTSARPPRTAGWRRNADALPLRPALRVGALAFRLRAERRARRRWASRSGATARRGDAAGLRAGAVRAGDRARGAALERVGARCSRRSSTRSRSFNPFARSRRARRASRSSCPARRARLRPGRPVRRRARDRRAGAPDARPAARVRLGAARAGRLQRRARRRSRACGCVPPIAETQCLRRATSSACCTARATRSAMAPGRWRCRLVRSSADDAGHQTAPAAARPARRRKSHPRRFDGNP